MESYRSDFTKVLKIFLSDLNRLIMRRRRATRNDLNSDNAELVCESPYVKLHAVSSQDANTITKSKTLHPSWKYALF